MVNCQFSEPVKADGVPPNLNSQEWNFSKMTCSGGLDFSTSSVPAYISTTTGEFYVQKTFTYGEILVLAFLIPAVFIILVFGIRKILIHKFLNG